MTTPASRLTNFQLNQSVAVTTSTIRTLRLKSLDADQSQSPTEKSWILPPVLNEAGTKYKISLKSLHLFHVFGNFANFNNTLEVVTTGGSKETIVIAPGDYTADTLVDYLYSTLQTSCGVAMSYDPIQNHFHWTPNLKVGSATTCLKELGLPGSNETTGYDESVWPINLSGVSRVEVDTDLTLNTLPMSGHLATVPVSAKFGEMIDFQDPYGAYPIICVDQTLRIMTVRLLDQDGVALSDYIPLATTSPYYNSYVPGWEITLAFESYGDPGFQNTLSQLVNGAVADVSQLPTPGNAFIRQEYTGTPRSIIAPLVSSGHVIPHKES